MIRPFGWGNSDLKRNTRWKPFRNCNLRWSTKCGYVEEIYEGPTVVSKRNRRGYWACPESQKLEIRRLSFLKPTSSLKNWSYVMSLENLNIPESDANTITKHSFIGFLSKKLRTPTSSDGITWIFEIEFRWIKAWMLQECFDGKLCAPMKILVFDSKRSTIFQLIKGFSRFH